MHTFEVAGEFPFSCYRCRVFVHLFFASPNHTRILKSVVLLLQLQSGWVGLPPGDRRASMGSSLPPYAKHPRLFPGCVRQVCIQPMPRVDSANKVGCEVEITSSKHQLPRFDSIPLAAGHSCLADPDACAQAGMQSFNALVSAYCHW